jgi:hypothetical protein
LQKKETQLKALTDQLSLGKYNGNENGNRIYGSMLALSPQTSLDSMALLIPMSYAALFANANIPVQPKCLAASAPSASALIGMIDKVATDAMFCALNEINTEQSRVFLICDKGPRGNFVKIIAYYSKKEQRVKTFNVDNDEVGGTSEDCATAIKHSMVKLFGEANAVSILWGQCTDSGGGGTGKSFFKALQDERLTVNPEQYMTSYCTLHCLQLTLAVPAKTILGEGGMTGKGLFRENSLQLLHGLYNLQDNHEKLEWKTIWKCAAVRIRGVQVSEDDAIPIIPCPITTRWWTVGSAAVFLINHWDIIEGVVQGVINRLKTQKKENQIASGVQSLMAEPVIKSDTYLLSAFHKYFLFSHFAWLQKGDERVGGTPGFLARHIGVRYFLMHADLTEGVNNWANLPEFEEFNKSLDNVVNENEKQLQKDKVGHFFRMARQMLEKHFDL